MDCTVCQKPVLSVCPGACFRQDVRTRMGGRIRTVASMGAESCCCRWSTCFSISSYSSGRAEIFLMPFSVIFLRKVLMISFNSESAVTSLSISAIFSANASTSVEISGFSYMRRISFTGICIFRRMIICCSR